MCLEIRDGAEESECRICSEKAAQVLGASFRRDRRTVQGLTWNFGVFQKAGAHFQKKIIKKKRHSHSQRNVQSRPTTVRGIGSCGRFSPRGVQERLVLFALAVAASGLGLGHGMTCSSNHHVFSTVKEKMDGRELNR